MRCTSWMHTFMRLLELVQCSFPSLLVRALLNQLISCCYCCQQPMASCPFWEEGWSLLHKAGTKSFQDMPLEAVTSTPPSSQPSKHFISQLVQSPSRYSKLDCADAMRLHWVRGFGLVSGQAKQCYIYPSNDDNFWPRGFQTALATSRQEFHVVNCSLVAALSRAHTFPVQNVGPMFWKVGQLLEAVSLPLERNFLRRQEGCN